MARQRKKAQTGMMELNMTPMIDVVFQLLVYFVLTFEIPKAVSDLQVYRPAGTPPKSGEPPPSVRIMVADKGIYAFNEVQTSLDTIRAKMLQLSDADKNMAIVVQCTMESIQQDLVNILDICASAGFTRVSVLTIGE